MMRPILLTTLICLCAFAGHAKDTNAPALHPPCAFIENKGQVTDQGHVPRKDIQFKVAAAHGLNIFIGDGAIHYQFSRLNPGGEASVSRLGIHRHEVLAHTAMMDMYRMDVELVGANKHAQIVTDEQQDYYENYVANGKQGAMAYSYNKITYKDIYPHIDWVLYLHDGLLKHEFVVNRGGRVSDIQLKYRGATALQLNADGSVVATTPQGVITEQAPVSYDGTGQLVKSNFRLNGDVLMYAAANYTGTLVIDPSLIWATYYGGADDDGASGVASDAAGNVYISGGTASLTGIATSGSYQAAIGGGEDAFLAKFNSSGAIMWATYYGGGDYDEGQGVATDGAGNVYMTGASTSTSGGTANVFLIKFSSAGVLQWVTNYGGSNEDVGLAVAADGLGDVYVTGWSISPFGMGTTGAYQGVCIGGADAFVTKFSSLSGAIQWSTYYGGSGNDYSNGVATDAAGNVYITGVTGSTTGIATPGTYQPTSGGGKDAFLAKFNNAGLLQWATYYGGTGDDAANAAVKADSADVFIAGITASTAGIATAGAYKDTLSGTNDAFVAKFSNAGSLQWATYYGGERTDTAYGVATDGNRNVYITGGTSSRTGVALPGAYQDTIGGGTDVFVAKFSTAGNIEGATYYGGGQTDNAYGIAGVGIENVYVAGNTQSTTGIATAGTYQTVYGGVSDGFLARFYICLAPVVGALTGPASVCAGSAIALADTTAGGAWSVANSSASVSGGIVTGVAAGTDTVVYAKTSSCSVATVSYTVTINALPDAGTITGDDTVCIGTTITLADAVTGGAWAASNAKAGVAAGVVTGMTAGTDTIKYSITATCTGMVQKIVHIIHCQTAVSSIAMPGEEMSIYPNPTTDNITIAATVPLDKVVICNEAGQEVFSGAYQTNSAVVSLAQLPVGIYIVRINDRNVYKVVRQ